MPLNTTVEVAVGAAPADVLAGLTGLGVGDRVRLQNAGPTLVRHGEFRTSAAPSATTPAFTLVARGEVSYRVATGVALYAWTPPGEPVGGTLIIADEA